MPKHIYVMQDKEGFYIPQYGRFNKKEAEEIRNFLVSEEYRKEFPVRKVEIKIMK